MRHSTLYFHYRYHYKECRYQALTFAIEPIFHPNDETKLSHLLVGMAKCSSKDQFCKKKGRQVALAKEPINLTLKELPKFVSIEINKVWDEELQFPEDFYWLVMRFI